MRRHHGRARNGRTLLRIQSKSISTRIGALCDEQHPWEFAGEPVLCPCSISPLSSLPVDQVQGGAPPWKGFRLCVYGVYYVKPPRTPAAAAQDPGTEPTSDQSSCCPGMLPITSEPCHLPYCRYNTLALLSTSGHLSAAVRPYLRVSAFLFGVLNLSSFHIPIFCANVCVQTLAF